VIGGVEQKAYFFAYDLPHSDACYVRAYPRANTEAWLDGHVHVFAFFGAVPQTILYDNDRCLVAKIMPDGVRKRTQRFSAMLSHYVIDDRYGRPGKGNDKGKVEGLVGYARRNFIVPMPRFVSWDAFNDYLEDQCLKRQKDVLRGCKVSIGERLEADLAAMQALPAAPFEACNLQSGQVTSTSMVRFQNNDYSVPVAYGHPLPGSGLPLQTMRGARSGSKASLAVSLLAAWPRLLQITRALTRRMIWCLTRCITCH
jgi:hypothetical protein